MCSPCRIIPIAIIAVVAYFVIGGLVKYYHYGARGVEIIPNYTFWNDLKVIYHIFHEVTDSNV